MKAPSKKLLALTHDVALRLGVDAEIVSRHVASGDVPEFGLVFPQLGLDQVKELLSWLDYYVPTLDEQKVRGHGPMVSEEGGPHEPRPSR